MREVGLVAVLVHQVLPVLAREGLEHPVGVAGGGHAHAPARDVTGGVLLHELRRHALHLGPGGGRLLWVEAGFLERLLVPVKDDGRALERDAVGLALVGAVRHQRRVEGLQPLPVGADVVEGDDHVLLEQLVDVDGEEHRHLRRLPGFQRRERLDARVVVVAGVDGVHLDVGMLLLEAGDEAVDHLGERPADRDRIVEGELGLALREGRAGEKREQQAQKSFHVLLPSELKICTAPGSQPRRTGEPGASMTSPGARTRSEASPTRALTIVSAPWYSALATVAAMPSPSMRMCSGRMPAVRPAAAPGWMACKGTRFIAGVPMKRAAKVLAGFAYSSAGVPACSILPARSRITWSAMLIASTWSCVT